MICLLIAAYACRGLRRDRFTWEIRMTNITASRLRRGIALVSMTGVLAVTGLATVVATTGTANAAGQPDLSITQTISGGTEAGQTFDRFTVVNHCTATASHINVELLITTKSHGFLISYAGPGTCEIMPAPAPYNFASACQFTDSLGAGDSVTSSAVMTGTAGKAFTALAEVGLFQPDSNVANNHSTVSSYFGIRADLAVRGTAKVGTKSGHATAVTTVVNRGPNTSSALQQTVEIKKAKSVSVSGTPHSTCQIIPAASGYNLAASCVTSKLTNRQKWVLTFDYHGTSRKRIVIVTKVTALTKDPVTTNNTMTRHTVLK
jgi:hypothetical protein